MLRASGGETLPCGDVDAQLEELGVDVGLEVHELVPERDAEVGGAEEDELAGGVGDAGATDAETTLERGGGTHPMHTRMVRRRVSVRVSASTTALG